MKRVAVLRILALCAACTVFASGCNWFRGTRSSENVEPPAELTEFTPTATVTELWSRNVGEGEGRLGLRLAPAAADGRVYVADVEGEVRAYDAVSGSELWRSELGARFSSAPAIAGDLLVFGTLDGQVIAVDADSGAERWRAPVSSEVVAPPAAHGDTVVVRSYDGRLFGLELASGARRWLYDRGLPSLTLRGNSPPLIGGDVVYAGYDDGQMVALRLSDGSQIWEQMIAEPSGRNELARMVDIDGAVASTGSELYTVAYHGQVQGLAAESGSPLWNRELSSYGGVAMSDDALFVADEDGVLWSLDRRNGAALWRVDTLGHRWLTTPAVQGDTVVVGDLEGYLHWFDVGSGEPVARERIGSDPVRARPVVSDGVLFAITTDGELAAYRISDG